MGMSEYVRSLREKIGHDLLFMPSAHVLIADGADRVLLVHHVEGRWQLPGGAVEPGEGPGAAARRECLEEIGVPVELERIAGVYGGPQHRFRYANGDEVGWVSTIFAGRIVEGEPVPSDDETDRVAWFRPDELDGLDLSPATRAILRDVRDGVSFR